MSYLKRTRDYMLTNWKSRSLKIIRYSHPDFVGCLNRRDFTLWYIFNHGNGVNILFWDIEPYDMTIKFCHWLACCSNIKSSLSIYCENNSIVLYFNNNWSSTKLEVIDIKYMIVKERIKKNKDICRTYRKRQYASWPTY